MTGSSKLQVTFAIKRIVCFDQEAQLYEVEWWPNFINQDQFLADFVNAGVPIRQTCSCPGPDELCLNSCDWQNFQVKWHNSKHTAHFLFRRNLHTMIHEFTNGNYFHIEEDCIIHESQHEVRKGEGWRRPADLELGRMRAAQYDQSINVGRDVGGRGVVCSPRSPGSPPPVPPPSPVYYDPMPILPGHSPALDSTPIQNRPDTPSPGSPPPPYELDPDDLRCHEDIETMGAGRVICSIPRVPSPTPPNSPASTPNSIFRSINIISTSHKRKAPPPPPSRVEIPADVSAAVAAAVAAASATMVVRPPARKKFKIEVDPFNVGAHDIILRQTTFAILKRFVGYIDVCDGTVSQVDKVIADFSIGGKVYIDINATMKESTKMVFGSAVACGRIGEGIPPDTQYILSKANASATALLQRVIDYFVEIRAMPHRWKGSRNFKIWVLALMDHKCIEYKHTTRLTGRRAEMPGMPSSYLYYMKKFKSKLL